MLDFMVFKFKAVMKGRFPMSIMLRVWFASNYFYCKSIFNGTGIKNGIVFTTAPLASKGGRGVRGASHLLHEGGAETPNAHRNT